MKHHETQNLARAPRLWRAAFTEAIKHPGNMQRLSEELEAALHEAPEDDYVRARLSIVLRRTGRLDDGLALLRGRTRPLAVAQHALNRAADPRLTEEQRPNLGQALLSELPERFPNGEGLDEDTEARMKLELARATALDYTGERDRARDCYLRAEVLAELLDDETSARNARALAQSLNQNGMNRVPQLQEELRLTMARTDDPIQIHNAAMMLADAAWEEERYDLLPQTIAVLPEGDPARTAYGILLTSLMGKEPPVAPLVHPAYTLALAPFRTAQMLRARDLLEPARATDLAHEVLSLGLNGFTSPLTRVRLNLWRALAHDVLRDYAAVDHELTVARRHIPEHLLPMRVFVDSIAVESTLRRNGTDDELRHLLGCVVRMIRKMNPQQAALIAQSLVVYAPHVLSVILQHFTNPVMSDILSGGVIVISNRPLINALLLGTTLPAARAEAHRDSLRNPQGPTRSALIRPYADRLRNIRLEAVPDLQGE